MIRKATLQDFDYVCSLAVEFLANRAFDMGANIIDIKAQVAEHLTNENRVVLLADGGFISGLFHNWIYNTTVKMVSETGWFVKPEYRNSGLGKQLRKALEDYALEMGASYVSVGEFKSILNEQVPVYYKNENYVAQGYTYIKRLK